MRRFKFELGGSYVYYYGYTLGRAIKAFNEHRPERLVEITAITEDPVREHERP